MPYAEPPRGSVLLRIALLLVAASASLHAALPPKEVEIYDGQLAPAFSETSLAGATVESSALRGRPVALIFFATWCPPCREELARLTRLSTRLGERVQIVAAACDGVMLGNNPSPEEMADTTAKAIALVAEAKLPFPVVVTTRALAGAYHVHGIPTTVVIDADGKIVTTFEGLQPEDVIAQRLLATAAPAAAHAPTASPPTPTAEAQRAPGDQAPAPSAAGALMHAYASVGRAPRQWHPAIVHLPIALLLIEAVLSIALWRRRSEEIARWSWRILLAAALTLPFVVVAGLHDSGLDHGEGNRIALGLADRWSNLGRAESSITVHTWLALLLVALVVVRLAWRSWFLRRAPSRSLVIGDAALLVVALWTLLAGAAVGGGITHG